MAPGKKTDNPTTTTTLLKPNEKEKKNEAGAKRMAERKERALKDKPATLTLEPNKESKFTPEEARANRKERLVPVDDAFFVSWLRKRANRDVLSKTRQKDAQQSNASDNLT